MSKQPKAKQSANGVSTNVEDSNANANANANAVSTAQTRVDNVDAGTTLSFTEFVAVVRDEFDRTLSPLIEENACVEIPLDAALNALNILHRTLKDAGL